MKKYSKYKEKKATDIKMAITEETITTETKQNTLNHFNKLTDEEKRTIVSARPWNKEDRDYPYYKQWVNHWNPWVIEYKGKTELTYCVECGTEIPSNFHTCPVCGTEYED